METLSQAIHVSRPGFWFITLWLYLVPCGGHPELISNPNFWSGLVYVTFPLNLLTYSWNDLNDNALDDKNPRKGKYLLGANKVDHRDILKVRNLGFVLNLVFACGFSITIGVVKTLLLGISASTFPL